MTGEPAFFEIGVQDPEKGRAFYGALFGWTFDAGPSGHGYVLGTPGLSGGMHGGDAGASPYLFFRVNDLDAALERVRDLGGMVEAPIEDGDETQRASAEARYGRFRLCRDDQGSAFGLHEPPTAP